MHLLFVSSPVTWNVLVTGFGCEAEWLPVLSTLRGELKRPPDPMNCVAKALHPGSGFRVQGLGVFEFRDQAESFGFGLLKFRAQGVGFWVDDSLVGLVII